MRHFLKIITALQVKKVTKYGILLFTVNFCHVLNHFLENRKSQDEFSTNTKSTIKHNKFVKKKRDYNTAIRYTN
jgi:hypothetical protein